MPLPAVRFTVTQGNIGRPVQGFDHYSAMIGYYSATVANSAYAGIGDKIYNSIIDAEKDGINTSYSDATAATSGQTVTATGNDGDTTTITFTDWLGNVIPLGTYTKITADSTATLVATGIVAVINGNTYASGFSATVGSTGAFTITAPKKFGIWPNTKSVTTTITGTTAITNTAFTGGTKSYLALFHYQIAEFFRPRPNKSGVLYFSIKLDTSTNNIGAFNSQIQADGLAVCNAFSGNARRMLFYSPVRVFATSTLDALKALRTTLFNQYTPALMGLLAGNDANALSAKPNLRALQDDGVSCILTQSGSGVGYDLSKTQLQTIGSAGLWLGYQSLVISDSIGQTTSDFNLSDGSECAIAAFLDGTTFDSISSGLADQLYDYGYTFMRYFAGNYAGTYWNGGLCCVAPSSDFAFTEDIQTLDKAVRDIYVQVVSLLNRKNKANADGTLTVASQMAYNEKGAVALDDMIRNGHIGDGSNATTDPTAIVATTGIVPINVQLLKMPIGRDIAITIGFVAKL